MGGIKMNATILSELTKLKRKDILQHIRENYPLFRLGRDRMDTHMAVIITRTMRKQP